MKRIFIYVLLMLSIVVIGPKQVYAKRGCCSHHGGVAYCGRSGKYICNDGTTSPSCTCSSGNNSSSSSSSSSSKKKNATNNNSNKKNSTSSNQTKKSNSSQKNSSDASVKVSKSSIATLSKLTINGEEVPITNEIEYMTQEESLDISYVPTDSKATVKLEQPSHLIEGSNTVKLIVTAEDGKTKIIYTLLVLKENKEVKESDSTNEVKEELDADGEVTVLKENNDENDKESENEKFKLFHYLVSARMLVGIGLIVYATKNRFQ